MPPENRLGQSHSVSGPLRPNSHSHREKWVQSRQVLPSGSARSASSGSSAPPRSVRVGIRGIDRREIRERFPDRGNGVSRGLSNGLTRPAGTRSPSPPRRSSATGRDAGRAASCECRCDPSLAARSTPACPSARASRSRTRVSGCARSAGESPRPRPLRSSPMGRPAAEPPVHGPRCLIPGKSHAGPARGHQPRNTSARASGRGTTRSEASVLSRRHFEGRIVTAGAAPSSRSSSRR